MFEWLILSSLQFAVFDSVKNDVCKTFARYRIGWCWKSLIRMFLKLWHDHIIWYLFPGLRTIILCSVWSLWFVKYTFFLCIYKKKIYKKMNLKNPKPLENVKKILSNALAAIFKNTRFSLSSLQVTKLSIF